MLRRLWALWLADEAGVAGFFQALGDLSAREGLAEGDGLGPAIQELASRALKPSY